MSAPTARSGRTSSDTGGGKRTSADLGVPFLGEVPIDPEVVIGGDTGAPIVSKNPGSPAAQAYNRIAQRIASALAAMTLEEGAPGESLFIDWEKA